VALPIGGGGRAEPGRRARDAVFRQLLGQRVDVRRAVDADHHGAFLLVALVGLHALRHLVLVVDLDGPDRVAADTAFRVHELDVVVVAGAGVGADRVGGARRAASDVAAGP